MDGTNPNTFYEQLQSTRADRDMWFRNTIEWKKIADRATKNAKEWSELTEQNLKSANKLADCYDTMVTLHDAAIKRENIWRALAIGWFVMFILVAGIQIWSIYHV